MADKNIQMTQRNASNTSWDNLNPITLAANVKMADGSTAENKVMSHLNDDVNHINYVATTGSANTYVATLSPAAASLVDGLAISVKINVANTGASTLNVNGLGAKTIKRPNGTDVPSGYLKVGSIHTLRYNSSTGFFILQGEVAYGNATASDLLSGKTCTTDAGEVTGIIPISYPDFSDQLSATNMSVGVFSGDGQNYLYLGVDPWKYLSGINWIRTLQPNLISSNIKNGTTVLQVAGTHPNVLTGTTEPTAGQGVNGDYYVQT